MDRLFPAACLFAALLTGCAQHTPKQAAPPLRVGVAEAAVDSVPNRMSFIGYLASNFDAVIQPRVNGYLSSKQYGNGMPVRRGQLLFTIDPDQLSTSMLAAEAELESARAQALEARNNYDRAVPLASKISNIGWDVTMTADGPLIIEANTIPGFNTAQYRSYAWVTDGYGYQPLFDELNGRPFVNNDHYARVLLKLD